MDYPLKEKLLSSLMGKKIKYEMITAL